MVDTSYDHVMCLKAHSLKVMRGLSESKLLQMKPFPSGVKTRERERREIDKPSTSQVAPLLSSDSLVRIGRQLSSVIELFSAMAPAMDHGTSTAQPTVTTGAARKARERQKRQLARKVSWLHDLFKVSSAHHTSPSAGRQGPGDAARMHGGSQLHVAIAELQNRVVQLENMLRCFVCQATEPWVYPGADPALGREGGGELPAAQEVTTQQQPTVAASSSTPTASVAEATEPWVSSGADPALGREGGGELPAAAQEVTTQRQPTVAASSSTPTTSKTKANPQGMDVDQKPLGELPAAQEVTTQRQPTVATSSSTPTASVAKASPQDVDQTPLEKRMKKRQQLAQRYGMEFDEDGNVINAGTNEQLCAMFVALPEEAGREEIMRAFPLLRSSFEKALRKSRGEPEPPDHSPRAGRDGDQGSGGSATHSWGWRTSSWNTGWSWRGQ